MPTTLRLQASRPEDIVRAAEILRAGGLVAFPTETVYGLGANATSARAVESIFRAKQRPAWDPLIVHVTGLDRIEQIAQLQDSGLRERVELLAQSFWPGPLTLLLPRQPDLPDAVTAGRALVGVRVPIHPVAQVLLRMAEVPVAAPSANRFGHISPTAARHVLEDLDGRIDAVLDGGSSAVGVESTVLDPMQTPMLIYRAGAVTARALEQLTGVAVRVHEVLPPIADSPEALPSPGVGIRHYAPEVPLKLCDPNPGAFASAIEGCLATIKGKVGVLTPLGWEPPPNERIQLQPWGQWDDISSLASGLFAGLRSLEGCGAAEILCPLPAPGIAGDMRAALRDRLLKAAMPR